MNRPLIKMLTAASFFSVSSVFAFGSAYVPQATTGLAVVADGGYSGLIDKLSKKHERTLVNQSVNGGKKTSNSIDHFVWGGHVEAFFPMNRLTSLGLQGGYLNFGDQDVNGSQKDGSLYSYKANTAIIPVMAALNMLFDDNFNFSLKAGAAYVMQKMTFVHAAKTGVEHTQTGFKPIFSVGLGYLLNNRIKLELSYFYMVGSKSQSTDIQPTDIQPSGSSYHGHILSQDAVLFSLGYVFNA